LAIPALDVTQKSDQPNMSKFFSVESFAWFPGFSPIIFEVLTLLFMCGTKSARKNERFKKYQSELGQDLAQ